MRRTCLKHVFAVSQIITRNLGHAVSRGRALWINPEPDDGWRSLREHCDSLKLFCQDYGAFRFLQQTGADTEFGVFPQCSVGCYDWIVLNLPRQKALLAMMLDCAVANLADRGILWLAGENRAGIKSAKKLLEKRFKQVIKLDNARHCGLYQSSGQLDNAPFDPRTWRAVWQLDYDGYPLDIISYPGVFAHGRLDEGTALLLSILPDQSIRGDVLDFACGAGVIGTGIAKRHPDTQVTLLDTNALALRACEETLAANQATGTVLAADGLDGIRQRFDLVVTNPPIHAGIYTDTRLGMRLLDAVHDHLHAGGRLLLVANRHLPYEGWLASCFGNHAQLAINDNFKVLMAKK